MQQTNLDTKTLNLDSAGEITPDVPKLSRWQRISLRLTPKFVRRAKDIYRIGGMRAVIKDCGWKLLVGLFFYYLIRDSILYLLIPYMLAKGMF